MEEVVEKEMAKQAYAGVRPEETLLYCFNKLHLHSLSAGVYVCVYNCVKISPNDKDIQSSSKLSFPFLSL